MEVARSVGISGFLSKRLRHQPGRPGLTLPPSEWVMVGDLLSACARRGAPLNRADLPWAWPATTSDVSPSM
jgi:RNA:NAD 2'-phosphotransferase (TPT1/KptA family)